VFRLDLVHQVLSELLSMFRVFGIGLAFIQPAEQPWKTVGVKTTTIELVND
jgi:hypothetical protein